MLAIGQRVLLVDARGCHAEHPLRKGDAISAKGVIVRGAVWSLLFFRVTPERTVDGLPVLRADGPAIAPKDGADTRLYVPEGWHPPEDLPARLGKAS